MADSDPQDIAPEDIALRALGEEIGSETIRRIERDQAAEFELDSLRGAVASARRSPYTALEQPPASLWDGIAASIEPDRTIVPMEASPAKQSGRRTRLLVGIAAACLIVAGIAGYSLNRSDVTRVATVELAAKEGGTQGTASLIRKDGRYQLEVKLQNASVERGHYKELWLLKADGSGLLSLGPAVDSGTYNIPQSVEVRSFPVVDVSDEPVNGDPTHSGTTLCRGTLQNV